MNHDQSQTCFDFIGYRVGEQKIFFNHSLVLEQIGEYSNFPLRKFDTKLIFTH